MATLSPLRSWLPDRHDRSAYLQVTGHPAQRVVTVSHWHDRVCLASTVVDVDDIPELVSILTGTLAEMARAAGPQPDSRPLATIALERLRARWRRPRGEIIQLFKAAGRASDTERTP